MDYSNFLIGGRVIEADKCVLRRIKAEDSDEMRRMRIIEDDPSVVEFVEGLQATFEGLLKFAKGNEEIAVAGVIGKRGFVGDEDADLLQGWICLYPDEVERLTRLKDAGLLKDDFDKSEYVEISYAKYPGAASGQMSSGLRKVVEILAEELKDSGQKIFLTAYTDQRNLNSSNLLRAVGFSLLGQIAYHSDAVTLDDFWVLEIKTPARGGSEFEGDLF